MKRLVTIIAALATIAVIAVAPAHGQDDPYVVKAWRTGGEWGPVHFRWSDGLVEKWPSLREWKQECESTENPARCISWARGWENGVQLLIDHSSHE
jgi:hypothetical protein